MPITYLEGDATNPVGPGPKIIAHVCNDAKLWGRGFVLAVEAKWPLAKRAYKNWTRAEDNVKELPLGSVQLVGVEIYPDGSKPDIWVANMIGQHGIKSEDGVRPIRYDAIRTALIYVAQDAKQLDTSIHMPRIGCGLAGGTWDKVGLIVEETLADLDVYVYDYRDTSSRSYVQPNI